MTISRVKLPQDDAEVLAQNLIEYNMAQRKCPIPAGSELSVLNNGVFEQFTRHPNRKIIPSGSFTHIVDCGDDFFQMSVGRYCSIARGSHVVNGHHPLHSVTTNPYHYAEYYRDNLPENLRYTGGVETFERSYGRGKIGNDVWIGAYCVIRSGITIGDGAVIPTGSVITKDVAPYSIVGGNPAKLIRLRFDQEIVDRFMNLQWWNYSPESFRDINMFNVVGFLDEMECRKEAGDLIPFHPNRFCFHDGRLT